MTQRDAAIFIGTLDTVVLRLHQPSAALGDELGSDPRAAPFLTRGQSKHWARPRPGIDAVEAAGANKATSPMEQQRGVVERRIDPTDGRAHTLNEFLEDYGRDFGAARWAAAATDTTRSAVEPSAFAVEKRVDPTDGNPYTLEEFWGEYGEEYGSARWEAARAPGNSTMTLENDFVDEIETTF